MIKILNTKSLYASLYEAVRFCKENTNDEINVIVPDKLALFMEKFLLEKINISASFKIKVSTLNRYAKRKLSIDNKNIISDIGCVLLINKILNKNIYKLETLKSHEYSFSYAENILRTLNQFKASRISYNELENFKSSNIQLANKIKDLAFIYKEFETLKAGLLDSSDLFLMSTTVIAEGLTSKNFLFVGFDDFTSIEYAIIEQLSMNNNVIFLTNYSKGNNKRIFNIEIYSQLQQIANITNQDFKVEFTADDYTDCKSFLQNNLFAVNNEKFVLNNETISVFSANSVEEEVEFVARNIRNEIIDGNKFSQYGVAIFGLENYVNNIKEIFEKYEINYYIDSEMSLNSSVIYKFICSLLKYNLESYNLSHLIDIISSPFFILDEGKKHKLIDKLLNLNFKGKVNGNTNFGDELQEEISLLSEFLSNFSLNDKLSCEEIINILKQGLISINSEEIINTLAEDVDLENKQLLIKSKEQILTTFEDILQFNRELKLGQFLDVFTNISTIIKIKNLPLSLDAVKVTEATNSMEIFDNLFIVNCTSDTAPSYKYDCGIILDSEIEQLKFKNKLAPTIAHINSLSRLRLFNLSVLFEKNLMVTYSQKPSELIMDLLNKIQVQTSKGVRNLVPFVDLEFSKYVALSLYDYIEFLCKHDKHNVKINEIAVKNKDFSNISSENLKIFNNLNEISCSYLENYFNCPFYCFLQNTMRIYDRNDSEILPFDIGNILHEVVFKYYKNKKKIEDIYEFCKNEIFNFVGKNERLKLSLESPIILNLIDESVRVITAVNYMDVNSTFVPLSFEQEFKGKNALKLKNINIIGKVDRVDVSGDILRVIDYKSGKAEANLKELYYGNKLQLFLYSCAMEKYFNKKAVGSFYLPLRNAYSTSDDYAYSLKGFFINEDFVIKALDSRAEIGFYSDIISANINKEMKAGVSKGVNKLNSNDMNLLKNYSTRISEQAVEELKLGYIKPSPSGNKNPCSYCPYVHVCLKNSNNVKFRNSKTVNATSFEEVEDV